MTDEEMTNEEMNTVQGYLEKEIAFAQGRVAGLKAACECISASMREFEKNKRTCEDKKEKDIRVHATCCKPHKATTINFDEYEFDSKAIEDIVKMLF